MVKDVPFPSLGRNNAKEDPGRHRDPGSKTADSDESDAELTEYLAALSPESDLETTGTGRRFGDAQVYQLRINPIAAEQLKELAAQQLTSPAALAQEWILERLAWEARTGD